VHGVLVDVAGNRAVDVERAAAVAYDTWHSLGSTEGTAAGPAGAAGPTRPATTSRGA
jgi:hypothetical protein